MTLKQQLRILRVLDQTLSQISPVSLRVLGISEDDANFLARERLISLGVDSSKPDILDQLNVIGILDAGLVMLAKHPERAPLIAKIGNAVFRGM